MTTIPVAICFNEKYAMAAGVTIYSMLYNSKVNQLAILEGRTANLDFRNNLVKSNFSIKARIIQILMSACHSSGASSLEEALNEMMRVQRIMGGGGVASQGTTRKRSRTSKIDITGTRVHSNLCELSSGHSKLYDTQMYDTYKALLRDFNKHYSGAPLKQAEIFLRQMMDRGVQSFDDHMRRYRDVKFEFYALTGDISGKTKAKLKRIVGEFGFASMRFINVEKMYENKPVNYSHVWESMSEHNHFSQEVFYKMLAAEVIDREKIVVSDVDVVYSGCIMDGFLDFDINGQEYLAAVITKEKQRLVRHKFAHAKEKWKRNYSKFKMEWLNKIWCEGFSGGYMIINGRKWREDGMSKVCLDFAIQNAGIIVLAEQDVLNIVCHERAAPVAPSHVVPSTNFAQYGKNWQRMRARRQCFSAASMHEAMLFPIQIHYVGRRKPWNFPEIPLADLWFSYAARTPFFSEYMKQLPNSIQITHARVPMIQRVVQYMKNNPAFLFKAGFYKRTASLIRGSIANKRSRNVDKKPKGKRS